MGPLRYSTMSYFFNPLLSGIQYWDGDKNVVKNTILHLYKLWFFLSIDATGMFVVQYSLFVHANPALKTNAKTNGYFIRNCNLIHREHASAKSPTQNSLKIYNNIPTEFRDLTTKQLKSKLKNG